MRGVGSSFHNRYSETLLFVVVQAPVIALWGDTRPLPSLVFRPSDPAPSTVRACNHASMSPRVGAASRAHTHALPVAGGRAAVPASWFCMQFEDARHLIHTHPACSIVCRPRAPPLFTLLASGWFVPGGFSLQRSPSSSVLVWTNPPLVYTRLQTWQGRNPVLTYSQALWRSTRNLAPTQTSIHFSGVLSCGASDPWAHAAVAQVGARLPRAPCPHPCPRPRSTTTTPGTGTHWPVWGPSTTA